MTELEVKAIEYIEINGGQVEDAGEGRQWNEFPSGKKISAGCRYMVKFNKKIVANKYLEHAIIQLHRSGVIDLSELGYDNCPKCNGTGNTGHNVDGGTCWKCNGFGIIKR